MTLTSLNSNSASTRVQFSGVSKKQAIAGSVIGLGIFVGSMFGSKAIKDNREPSDDILDLSGKPTSTPIAGEETSPVEDPTTDPAPTETPVATPTPTPAPVETPAPVSQVADPAAYLAAIDASQQQTHQAYLNYIGAYQEDYGITIRMSMEVPTTISDFYNTMRDVNNLPTPEAVQVNLRTMLDALKWSNTTEKPASGAAYDAIRTTAFNTLPAEVKPADVPPAAVDPAYLDALQQSQDKLHKAYLGYIGAYAKDYNVTIRMSTEVPVVMQQFYDGLKNPAALPNKNTLKTDMEALLRKLQFSNPKQHPTMKNAFEKMTTTLIETLPAPLDVPKTLF